jgi:hypothetical protein
MVSVKVRVAIEEYGRWVILKSPKETKSNKKLLQAIKKMNSNERFREEPTDLYHCGEGIYDIEFSFNEQKMAVAKKVTRQFETRKILITIAIGEDGRWINLTPKPGGDDSLIGIHEKLDKEKEIFNENIIFTAGDIGGKTICQSGIFETEYHMTEDETYFAIVEEKIYAHR